jgi:NADPH:quinone reductase-like Zn-dependent oxidoreductase
LNPQAIFVIIGGPKTNRWIGPLSHVVKLHLASLRASQKVLFFITKLNKEDLMVLQDLIEAGKVTPVIDRRYELSDFPEAMRYLGTGHAKGKVVITMESNPKPAKG